MKRWWKVWCPAEGQTEADSDDYYEATEEKAAIAWAKRQDAESQLSSWVSTVCVKNVARRYIVTLQVSCCRKPVFTVGPATS